MNREIQQRLQWVKMDEESGDASFVCRRCGISRKWVNRYKQDGIAGLESKSRRPHSSPDSKITNELRALILGMRMKPDLGARRLQTELIRLHQIHLSTATIHKVLSAASVKPIVTYRRKKDFQRYERPIPDGRVQMDTCKIAPGIYQYTRPRKCSLPELEKT